MSDLPHFSAKTKKTLEKIGNDIRIRRKKLKISAVETAEAAGISRVTLHRIEKGKPSVAVGAYVSVILALGADVSISDLQNGEADEVRSTQKIIPADYPQLKRLAWQLRVDRALTAEEALALYEGNWKYVDLASMEDSERKLLLRLLTTLGRGRLLV